MTLASARSSLAAAVLALACAAGDAAAQGPPGYYATVDANDATSLRQTLHAVIDDHQLFPYTAGSTDTWNILEAAQQDPANAGRVLDVYKNASHPKQGGGNALYEREHSWPSSYGFPDNDGQNYPFTDCHHLFLCDPSYNQARSNKPFRYCSSSCQELVTVANDGQGGGCCTYPGNSNWTSGSFTSGTWEVWSGRRGDIARAMFYMDVRYEGGTHTFTGFAEPDLRLTDSTGLISSGNTGENEAVAYMGILSDLLQWHLEDPVDDFERDRNDVVFSFQGNRNPFVDHPEWASCLYQGTCDTLSFYADVASISVSAGGTQHLTLRAGSSHPSHVYWVLGSATGTAPGLDLGGGLLLPLNFDDYTLLTITNPTLPIYTAFLGFLTINGDGNAAFVLPPADPGLVGLTLNHAYFTAPLFGSVSFTSDPVALTLAP
jgi:endonuclease I